MQTIEQWLDKQEARFQQRLNVLNKLRNRDHDVRRAELQVAAIQDERLRVQFKEEEYDLDTPLPYKVPNSLLFYFGPEWLWPSSRLGQY